MLIAAVKRMYYELRNYYADEPDEGVRYEPIGGNLMHLKGVIEGPEGSPYEGGKFVLDITIPENYPKEGPTIKFITKIWHPSVNSFDGTICLDNMGYNTWPLSMTVYKTLKRIRYWLVANNDIRPLDYDIYIQKRDNEEVFEKTAKFWTIKYAGAKFHVDPDCQMRVGLVMNITNNDEDLAIAALSCHDWALPKDIGNFV